MGVYIYNQEVAVITIRYRRLYCMSGVVCLYNAVDMVVNLDATVRLNNFYRYNVYTPGLDFSIK